MEILAPAINFKTGKAAIDAGAREIYICGEDEIFENFSFSGRGKISVNNDNNCCSYNELKELALYAHDNNTKINYLANMPFFRESIVKEGKSLEKYFFEYVERGIEAGVDSIVVGDIGLIYELYKRKYPVDIHASVYLKTINSEQANFLKEFNVNRVALSYHVKKNEIKKIIQNTQMEIEVMGHLGCSFYNGCCNFIHDLGKTLKEEMDVGIACKGIYSLKVNDKKISGKIFDKEKTCSLCSLHELNDIGVKALKIVGRDRNYEMNLKIIKIYSDYLNKKINKEEMLESLPIWWKRKYCRCNRCKFL